MYIIRHNYHVNNYVRENNARKNIGPFYFKYKSGISYFRLVDMTVYKANGGYESKTAYLDTKKMNDLHFVVFFTAKIG